MTMKKQNSVCVVKKPLMLAFYFACAGVGFLVMFLYAFDDELYIRLLAACVFAVPSLAGTMYFCTWMVSLDRKCIVFRKFFFTREYRYGEIVSASEQYSSKPRRMLKIEFVDGRCISIPSYCSNYNRAKQTLMKHVSIKVADLY